MRERERDGSGGGRAVGAGGQPRKERGDRKGGEMLGSNMPKRRVVFSNSGGKNSSADSHTASETLAQRQPRKVTPGTISTPPEVNPFLL